MNLIDASVLKFLVTHRLDWLSVVMLLITYTGGTLVIITATILSIIFFIIYDRKRYISPLLVSILGTGASVFVLKNIFDKARPLREALYLERTFSFPSAHAAFAVALYGFFIYIIWKHEKHHARNILIWALAILIILIGISRLYLGVHYLSDVIAGYAVGLIWLTIAISLKKAKII